MFCALLTGGGGSAFTGVTAQEPTTVLSIEVVLGQGCHGVRAVAGEALAGGLQPSSWASQWAGLLGWGGRAWACPLPPQGLPAAASWL